MLLNKSKSKTSDNLIIKNLTKSFGQVLALDHIQLTISSGSFFTFLGPSGCGKTTLLRIIAGFVQPDSGNIQLGDQNLLSIPAEKRGIGMVFQNYALFPHLTVYENIAYGLRIQGIPKHEIASKVQSVLGRMQLSGYDHRKITELSGGEQQRVALARSLAVEPHILLMDEPLSNLDARLRDQMREDIKTLQKQLGITTIFVTHDQKEALTLSDSIAIFDKGQCVQVGSPNTLYHKPDTAFVAQFLGDTNLITLDNTLYSLRPEAISLSFDSATAGKVKGMITSIQFNGSTTLYTIKTPYNDLKVITLSLYPPVAQVGHQVSLNWASEALVPLKR